MENKKKWLMPSYYRDFRCKANDCRHTCCSGWKIPVSKKEYDKLINLECDEDLYRNINATFIEPDFPTEEVYKYIGFNWLGNCPMQESGLCRLHACKGEEVLPKVCRLYPRSLKKVNGVLFASCSSSCERVVEMLYDVDKIEMVEDELDEEPQIEYEVDEKTIAQIRAFHNLICDKSTTLVQSIRDICVLINEDEFVKDFNDDKNPVELGLYILERLVTSNSFLKDITEEIKKRYDDNYYQYRLDCDRFETDFPKWMSLFENVINNSMMYENFPFVDKRFDKTEAYKGLCASYGLLRLVCVGYTSTHSSKEDLIDAVGALFHLIDHTSFYYNIHVIADNAAILLKL